MDVLKVDSPEVIDDIAERLYGMLKTVDSEVTEQTELYMAYLTTCVGRLAQQNPISVLIPTKLMVDFTSTVLRLGYYLAKKPWELEAQLNELKATYGTVPYEEDNNGKPTS